MSRIVWLDGEFADPSRASLSIDDPGVRWGEGLFETMRGKDGAVPWLDRHLDRLERSIHALGLAPMAPLTAVEAAVSATAARLGPDTSRIRLTVTARPTLLVDAEPVSVDPAAAVTAVTVRGAWHPARREAEHKTLSYLGWRRAQRQAEAAGGGIALLTDADGLLGEASTASAFAVTGGRIVTAPARGLLPGLARAAVMELADVAQEALPETAWRTADELFVTNALHGMVPVIACDGHPVGDGRPGPVTRALAEQVEALLTRNR